MSYSDIAPFALSDLRTLGPGLNRPECVLATPQGTVYAPDWTLGIARIALDGTIGRAIEADLIVRGFLPNGIALTPEGDFLFANLGEVGGVWRVGPTGPAAPFAIEVEGRPIPPANFVLVDGERVWITVSADRRGHAHFTDRETTGQILLVEGSRARVVADGLTWTNEMRLSPDRRFVFVNETFACRTTRFVLAADGSLSNPVQVVLPSGTFPDGMAFDAEGGLWVVCVVSNRILRIAPDLTWTVVFQDLAPDFEALAAAHADQALTRDMILNSRGARVSNLSSLAFGGPDLKTLYLGGLGVDRVQVLTSPVPGLPMAHWT